MNERKGYSIEKRAIVIKRKLNELDLFVKKFIDILKKHSDYLIVSGYVSISTGRTRGTEDVDVIIPLMKFSEFKALFLDLQKNSFWCYQGETSEEAYEYFRNFTSIRFAEKETLFPNIEFIPFDKRKKAKYYEFTHPQAIRVENFEFKIPPLEFEILYKELILKGKKDMEDAMHLRKLFSDILKEEKFKECKEIIRNELK